MPNTIKPRKKSIAEVLDSQIGPAYDPTNSKPPLEKDNRSKDISTKGDRTKDVSIGLIDIDTAIIKYIEEKVQPSVIQDGNRIKVPVMYGFPERWQTIQEKGYLREYSGRFMAPVIVIKRDSMEANRTLSTKVDANKPRNLYAFEQSYTKKNQYDRFSITTNRQPVKEFRLVVMPEYVTIKYSAVVFTNHLEQNNKIVEALQYAANTYWGEEGRFLFRSNINSFTTSTEYSLGDDRTTRTNFEITLNGYIIPDTVNRDISYPKKFVSKAQVIFNLETDSTEIFNAELSSASTFKTQAVSFPTAPQTVEATVDPAILTYLNTNITKVANVVTAPNLATFNGASFLQPPPGSGLPVTDKSSFSYFVNGQYIPLTAITSFDGSNLVFNTTILGYDLESDDEITATGKFA